MNPIINKILIADDHAIVRQGVEMILSSKLENVTFFHARTLTETMETLDKVQFDLLFLDLFFPDGNSMGSICKIRKNNPNLRIVVFSGMEDEVYGLPVLKAGAQGFINKLSSPEILESAIDKVLAGELCFSEATLAGLKQNQASNPFHTLSEREMEVLKLMAEGYGNLEICNSLSLQKSTVSTFIKRIKEKLGVYHQSQIIELYGTYKHIINNKLN